ncbi:MAG: hypothetical protein ACRDJ1_11640 [Actinomycetota bacterium]
MRSIRRFVPVVLVLAIGLAACGGDSKPTGSSDNTTPPATGVPNFSSSECSSAALAMAAAVSGSFANVTGSTDSGIDALRRMASAAPSEIKADVELVADATADFQQALKDAGFDPSNPSSVQNNPEALQKIGAAASAFQSSGAPAAVERIGTYFDQLCPGAR